MGRMEGEEAEMNSSSKSPEWHANLKNQQPVNLEQQKKKEKKTHTHTIPAGGRILEDLHI